MHEIEILGNDSIKNKIHLIRGVQVIIDSDLADLYEVETRVLNQTVNRNKQRFPDDFMFRLAENDLEYLKSQSVISSVNKSLRSQNVILENLKSQNVISSWGGKRKLPYAFTEQGVAMLSGILRSKKAIEVNIQIMRAFISMRKAFVSNIEIFNRIGRLEIKNIQYDENFKTLFDALDKDKLKKEKGVFFDGQVFDAYRLILDIIRSARESIVLIDNYIDDSVLTLFSKREKGVSVTILTNKISRQLKLDLEKYNSQYDEIKIQEFERSHDRFLIVDNKDVYHIGASLKDLGKKWFAFSRFDRDYLKF